MRDSSNAGAAPGAYRPRLILHAPNIHEGGGASVLTALIEARNVPVSRHVTVDARFVAPASLAPDITMERVAPTLLGRFGAEWSLRRLAQPEDTVLCLGNLPPLFALRTKATLFIQNRLLMKDVSLAGYRLKVRLRVWAERLWLRARMGTTRRIVVQTPTMRRCVERTLGSVADVLPFLPELNRSAGGGSSAEGVRRFDFIYVSSGLPHKNHLRLLDAWRLLAAEGIRPTLCVTVGRDHYPDLWTHIEQAKTRHGLAITNVGAVPAAALYYESRALIFPSLLESFGLPLLEAAAADLPVLAPERDYVRDVLDPVQTFDPDSAISIARAVKRHLGLRDARFEPTDADAFLRAILV